MWLNVHVQNSSRVSESSRCPNASLPDACDPIPTWLATTRKCATLATVVRLRRSGPTTLGQLDAEAGRLTDAALAAPVIHRRILNLWKIEGLVFRAFEASEDHELSLQTSTMPLAAGPPAHCGLAMAIVLRNGFHPERLRDRFLTLADPRFVRFCYETTGLMLAIAECRAIGAATRGLGSVGLFRRRLTAAPDDHGFLDSFSDEERRLAAHGYGRALYFTTVGFSRALVRARSLPGLPAAAALRGLNSANSLINSRDLDSLLKRDHRGLPPEVANGMEGGLFNTLSLLEWAFPGCLDELSRTNPRAARIIDTAIGAAETARENGSGPPLVA